MSFMSKFCLLSTKQEGPSPLNLPSITAVKRSQPENIEGWIHGSGQYWNITKTNYLKDKWSEKFKKGKYASARYIKFSKRSDYSYQAGQWYILKQIVHISFTELISLYLQKNGITSVEAIVHLKAPFLSNLDLRANNICDIRSLRKIGSKLDHLFLASNPIKDYNPIYQINFHKKIIVSFVVDYSNKYDQWYTINSMRPFFKTETRQVAGCFMIEMTRILSQEGSVIRNALSDR